LGGIPRNFIIYLFTVHIISTRCISCRSIEAERHVPNIVIYNYFGYFQFPKSLYVKPSRVVILSVGLLLPFEDFTSSVCCPLDRLPARRSGYITYRGWAQI